MRLRAARARLARAADEHHDRRAAVDRGGDRRDEAAAVAHVLDVDRDRLGGRVVGAGGDEVDQPDVGLVAERHEARDAEAAGGEEPVQLDGQVAALAEQRRRRRAGRSWRRGRCRRGCRRARGSSARRARHRPPGPARSAPPRGPGPRSPFSPEPGRDRHDRAGARARARRRRPPRSPASGTVSTARSTDVECRRPTVRHGWPRIVAAAPVDEVDGVPVGAAQRLGGDGVAPLRPGPRWRRRPRSERGSKSASSARSRPVTRPPLQRGAVPVPGPLTGDRSVGNLTN